ncbi:hypothetical protein TNCV_5033181, partial [Trichonephila clavipes]
LWSGQGKKKRNGMTKSYSRAFGNGSRNFEPWSSDEDDTSVGTPSPNYITTPQQREDV